MFLKRAVFIVVVFGLAVAGFYLTGKQESRQKDEVRVVTTVWPVYALVKPITGNLQVDSLTTGLVDPHNFSVNPRAVKLLNDADILFKNGAGLEPWLDDLLKTVGNKNLRVVDLSEGLELKDEIHYLDGITDQTTCERKGAQWSDCGPNECQRPGGEICPQVCGPAICLTKEKDPHVWLDPVLAGQMAIKAGRELTLLTGDLSFGLKGVDYSRSLEYLASSADSKLKAYQKRSYIIAHPYLDYFSARFKMKRLAAFELSPGQEPTLRDLKRIGDLVKKHNIKSIFVEPGESESYLENFAKEYNLELLHIDPMETGEFRPLYYEQVTQINLSNIIRALDLLNKK